MAIPSRSKADELISFSLDLDLGHNHAVETVTMDHQSELVGPNMATGELVGPNLATDELVGQYGDLGGAPCVGDLWTWRLIAQLLASLRLGFGL